MVKMRKNYQKPKLQVVWLRFQQTLLTISGEEREYITEEGQDWE